MDFEPVAALIKEERKLRAAYNEAQFDVRLAERREPDRLEDAKAAETNARRAWYEKSREATAEAKKFFAAYGLEPGEVRLALI